MENIFVYLKKQGVRIIIFAILIFSIIIRVKAEGDPRLSVANDDTGSYVSSSEVSLWSWKAFTGRRLFTTNVVYQLLKPDQGYKILANGSGHTTKRRLQSSVVKIALLQFIVSIIGWGALALSFSHHLKNSIPKVLAPILILIFAFVPQISDWDSILTSESLTFSLFALQAAFFIYLAFRFTHESKPSLNTKILTMIWVVIIFFWTFLKDAHQFGTLATVLMISATMILRKYREQRLLYAVVLVLSGFFVLGWFSSSSSSRSEAALINIYKVNILPVPARVEIMQSYGMPDPKSREFDTWFLTRAKNSYLRFMIFHPGYVITGYFRDLSPAFYETGQPYFNAEKELTWRNALIPIGDVFHPVTATPILMDLLIFLGILIISYYKNDPENSTWAWLGGWMLLFANINMFINIFGDTWALPRHTLLATTVFRLFMWAFIIVFIDLTISSQKKEASDVREVISG